MFPSRIADGRVTGPSRICQRCEQPGHAIYECKNPRPYKSRPTRTQVLQDPRLEAKARPRVPEAEIIRRYAWYISKLLTQGRNSNRNFIETWL